MKTAKEVLDANFSNVFDHSQKVLIKGFMKEYAREACKEQREICAGHAEMEAVAPYEWDIDYNSIKNAPEPELE